MSSWDDRRVGKGGRKNTPTDEPTNTETFKQWWKEIPEIILWVYHHEGCCNDGLSFYEVAEAAEAAGLLPKKEKMKLKSLTKLLPLDSTRRRGKNALQAEAAQGAPVRSSPAGLLPLPASVKRCRRLAETKIGKPSAKTNKEREKDSKRGCSENNNM